MSFLGVDVGTSGCKAVAFDLDGEPIASAYREYPLHAPRPGWQELDPDEVWSNVRTVIAETAAKTKANPVRALAVSAQGEACHAVDHQGRCLTMSPVTFDARTAAMPQWWLERKGRYEIAQITGMPLHGMYSLNKILWFKHNRPEVFRKASKFLCYEDFVHLKLGLEPLMSHSLAARTMALDVRTRQWSSEMLQLAEIEPSLLSNTAPSGTIVGSIPNQVASDLGLPHGTLVATGGHDQPASALGAGILESGEAVYATGTVECICPIFDAPAITPQTVENNLCSYPSCVDGLYASIAFNFTGGSLLKWYRDNFAGIDRQHAEQSNRDVYDIICEQIPPLPENLLILPHFTVTGTPYFDTESRGLITGLTLDTTRHEIASAILSGVTYEMKLNLEVLALSGVHIHRLRASGGGAKSPLWLQRKANILGVPIAVLKTTEAASLGVALLAGKAAGIVHNLAESARRAAKLTAVFEPEPTARAAYEERYTLYKELYPAIRGINARLAKLSSTRS